MEPRISSPESAIPANTTMATITAAARIMYPHDALPDAVYARVAARLAEAARADAGTARVIDDGVSALNRGRPFAHRSDEERLAVLRGIETTAFFELVRSTAVVEVYSDERTWQLVGYEGPSFDKGGYLNRGFNDLDWLPEPEPDS
ncbi:MAG TPA: hypothetical protein VHV09_07635 [Trebonia sp.]|jgi:hypothetical protein|nr:hypothetical protein [Trebonia sp.]